MEGGPVTIFAGHVEAQPVIEFIAEAKTRNAGSFESGVEDGEVRGLEANPMMSGIG
jgi:hypothetical protein